MNYIIDKNSKIYVAGHTGLVGSAILRNLQSKEYSNLITKTHQELDLTDQYAVKKFFDNYKPEVVILAAALVGGIKANSLYRANFIMKNMQIQCNVISEAYNHNVKKLLFLGSSCIYPKNANQPIKEDELLTNELEYTNEPYAIAKIAGLKMCESYNLQYSTNYISVMPTNLYGYGDNFNLETSHVLPGMLRKIHLAKKLMEKDYMGILNDLESSGEIDLDSYYNDYDFDNIIYILNSYGIYEDHVELWGTGEPLREFMWADDLADACVYLVENVNFSDIVGTTLYSSDGTAKLGKEFKNCHINIGTGDQITIKELALKIKRIVGYSGDIKFNSEMPDGTFRKGLNCDKLHSLGWTHKVNLDEGIEKLYKWYLDMHKEVEIVVKNDDIDKRARNYQNKMEEKNPALEAYDFYGAYYNGASEQQTIDNAEFAEWLKNTMFIDNGNLIDDKVINLIYNKFIESHNVEKNPVKVFPSEQLSYAAKNIKLC